MSKFNKPKESKGALKVRNYFLDLVDREDFKEEIRKLRIKYRIPDRGFSETEKHATPDIMPNYPERWAYGDDEGTFLPEFFADEEEICKKFKLPPGSIDIMDYYVMYNKILSITKISGLCMTQDCHDIGKLKEIDRNYDEGFPILIRVSPYASQRDILDYIKTAYTQKIKPLQNKYSDKKIKLGKIKSRSEFIRKRNGFIFEHRNLSIEKIRKLLAEMKIFLDDGHIGKIISLEIKRRKEV